MKFTPTMEEVLKWAEEFNETIGRKFIAGFSPNKTHKKAIHAKCVECSGYDGFEDIRNCSVRRCPLRPYRPYKNKGE